MGARSSDRGECVERHAICEMNTAPAGSRQTLSARGCPKMPNTMSAEVCFYNPDDLAAAMPVILAQGFEIRKLDWTDPQGGPHTWIMVDAITELDALGFLVRVNELV